MQPSREALEEALKLARAVKEEALAGQYTPAFLVIQLAAAVEQLAAAMLEHVSAEPSSNVPEAQPAAYQR